MLGGGLTDIVPGSGCTYLQYPDWGVACPDADYFAGDLGGDDDSVSFYNVGAAAIQYKSATIHGGAGNDTLEGVDLASPTYPNRDVFFGDSGADELAGYSGDDELHGGDDADRFLHGGAGNDAIFAEGGGDQYLNGEEGNDLVDGGPGDDTFGFVRGVIGRGDPGADTIVGGLGLDTMSYGAVTTSEGVTVRMDGLATDGLPGENDNIGGDVEAVSGTANADTLVGGAGNDTLDGDGGNDTLDGDGGNDVVKGGSDNDTVVGGPGQDAVYGDSGFCSVGIWGDCPGGQDTINTRDGERDTVDCGPSNDTATADAIDVVPTAGWPACETIVNGPVAPKDTTAPAIKLPDRKLKVDRRGYVRVSVTCPASEPPVAAAAP